jgi:hypothetical protein
VAEGGKPIAAAATAAASTVAAATAPKAAAITAKSRVAAPAPVRIDTDADGYQYRRGEIIALNLDPAGLERVKELGYQVVSSQRLEGADVTLHVLRGPPEAAGSLLQLRQASPSSTFALNHVFGPAADVGSPSLAPARPPVGRACACRVGIVDTGVDPTLREMRRTHLIQRGFGGGESRPQAHGDAVASLIADQMSGGGVAGPASELYVADMFSAGPQSGSAAALIGGLSWLAQSGTPVINISLTGPPNPVVAKVLQNIVEKGVVVVAAAGNDGVAAPPAFPAAYPQVVAVTAVDRSRRPYRYANRGPYLTFAALGVDILAAGPDDSPQAVSGTSFASPIVAVELARRLSRVDATAARQAVQALASEAVDLGAPGRDPIFGYGLIESRP